MAKLEIRLFGGFTTWQDDKVVQPFRTQKARALVAYLVLQPARAHARTALAELLWPDSPPKRAAHNLRQALTFLRPALNKAGLPPLLNVTRQTVSLSYGSFIKVDVLEFEKLAGAGTIPAMVQAIALYHGPLLAGFYLDGSPEYEIWMSAEREKWHSRVLALLDQLADHFQGRGDYPTTQTYLQQAITIDPWHEQAYRELMGLLALQGDINGALAQYERCCQILLEGLGVEPLPETQALAQQIQRGSFLVSAPPDLNDGNLFLKFVGREKEHARLVKILSERQPQHPRLVLLEGVLGIGKSRLMSEFRRYAAVHGAACLSGRCLSYQVPVPYQPLVMALRESLLSLREAIPQVWLAELMRLLPEIAAENPNLSQSPTTGDTAERQRLFSAVTHLIDRVGQPQQTVIMFLDDLHWADKASLDLLQFLLYEGPARLLIIGAYRPEDTPAAHPLTQLRRSLSRERRVEIIPLQPLEQTSIESLVANLVQASDRVRLAKFLSPESQGNPFFLTELLYSLREIAAAGSSVWKLPPGWEQDIQPLTRSMQDVVLDRVERLSPVSLNALKAAAVIGHTFEAAMLAAVSERDTAEFLVDWQQRHLVKSVGSGYEFAHHKIQQVVYETIRLAQRQAWHLAAGQYLAGQDGSTNRTTQLAHHYYHSAEPVLALPYFLQAAREAIEVLAFEEVVFLCTLALTLSPLELVVHYQLLQLRHRAYQFIGDTESEGRDAMEMVGLAQNSGDPRQLADAVQRLGRYYYLRGELEEARQTFSEVVGVAKASGDVGTAVRILDTLAMLFRGSVTGQKEALRLQDEALAMARDAAASQMEAMLLADKSVILAEIGILGTAVELIQRAEKLLRAENVSGYLPHVLYIRGGVYSLVGQYELAQADFDEALTLCKALNVGTYLTVIYSNMGRLALAAGKFDMARRHYSEMLHLAEVDGRPLVVGKAQLGLGWAAYLEADFQSAFDYLSRSIALCEREDVQNRVLAEALLGLTLVGLNETKQAVKVIDSGIKLFEAGEKVLVEKPQIFWSYYWILQEAGRTAEADHWLRAGRELVAAQAESLPEQWREAFYKSLNGRFLTAT